MLMHCHLLMRCHLAEIEIAVQVSFIYSSMMRDAFLEIGQSQRLSTVQSLLEEVIDFIIHFIVMLFKVGLRPDTLVQGLFEARLLQRRQSQCHLPHFFGTL